MRVRGVCCSGPATCLAKRSASNQFATMSAAKRVAKRLRRQGVRNVQCFACAWCGQYHVGKPGGVA